MCGGCGCGRFGVESDLPWCSATCGCKLHCVDANRIVMAAWMCRWCYKTHCNGCMVVAWALCWGGSRSTNPCVFPCQVAAAGDERFLLCAAGAAAVVSGSNRFSLGVLQHVDANCIVWMQIAL